MSQLAPARRRGLRGVAMATVAAFGCATARQPLAPPPPSPPVERVYFAEPDMELWVEGASSVDPAESEGARTASQAALHAALEGRGVPAAEADAVLFLRERAVARTSGRKSGQAAATAGMVVGIAVIVAVVVVALAASGGKGGSKGGGGSPAIKTGGHSTAPAPAVAASAPRAAGAATGAAAQAARVAVAVPPAHPTAPAPPPGAPAGAHPTAPAPPPGTVLARPVAIPESPPPQHFYLGVDVWTGPEPYQPDFAPPPPPPFSMKDRGFFDPDEVLLEMVLRDARSGAIIWSAALRGWADPRDRAEVAKLMEAALQGQAWARRGGAPAPAPPPAQPSPAG